MKGLLLKEFYNLKYYCLIYYLVDIFVFLIYLFATFYGLNNLGGKSGSMSLTESMGFLFNNSVASVTFLLFFSSFLMFLHQHLRVFLRPKPFRYSEINILLHSLQSTHNLQQYNHKPYVFLILFLYL